MEPSKDMYRSKKISFIPIKKHLNSFGDVFSRTVNGDKIWIDVGTGPDSDSQSMEPCRFVVHEYKDTCREFKNDNNFYLAVKDENIHEHNYIEFTLNINNREQTPVVSNNNCVINCTSSGWCIYNIPDLSTDGIKEEGPSVVDLVVGNMICYEAGIIVEDGQSHYIIETSVDLSKTDEKDIKVVFNGEEDDYDCKKSPGINVYKLKTAKPERKFISLDDWLEKQKTSRPPAPDTGQDESEHVHVQSGEQRETSKNYQTEEEKDHEVIKKKLKYTEEPMIVECHCMST